MAVPFIPSATIDGLALQQQQLTAEIAKNKQQLQKLNTAVTAFACRAEEANKASEQAQEYLSKEPFKTALQLRLEPECTQNPLQHMLELLKLAKKVKTKVAQQQLNITLKNLNKEAGKINAHSKLLEEKISKVDDSILQMRALLDARKKSIANIKNRTQELKQ